MPRRWWRRSSRCHSYRGGATVAKHISLREFQQALAAKLAEAGAETAPHARLGVQAGGGVWVVPLGGGGGGGARARGGPGGQAGGRLWLIRLDDAGEVLPLPEVTPVPLTRPWFLGLANIRGNLAGVVGFAAFMGEPPPERAPPG